jgi:hypothetical protein
LQKFIIHLVIGSAETNFKYPYDSSDLQDGWFRRCVINREHTADDLQKFGNSYISEPAPKSNWLTKR